MQHMYVKWWRLNPLKTITMPHNAITHGECVPYATERATWKNDCNAPQCHKLITSSKIQSQYFEFEHALRARGTTSYLNDCYLRRIPTC